MFLIYTIVHLLLMVSLLNLNLARVESIVGVTCTAENESARLRDRSRRRQLCRRGATCNRTCSVGQLTRIYTNRSFPAVVKSEDGGWPAAIYSTISKCYYI